jgi:hypothetical protein
MYSIVKIIYLQKQYIVNAGIVMSRLNHTSLYNLNIEHIFKEINYHSVISKHDLFFNIIY